MIFLFLTDQSFIFSTIVIEDPQVDKGENSYDDHPFYSRKFSEVMNDNTHQNRNYDNSSQRPCFWRDKQ